MYKHGKDGLVPSSFAPALCHNVQLSGSCSKSLWVPKWFDSYLILFYFWPAYYYRTGPYSTKNTKPWPHWQVIPGVFGDVLFLLVPEIHIAETILRVIEYRGYAFPSLPVIVFQYHQHPVVQEDNGNHV